MLFLLFYEDLSTLKTSQNNEKYVSQGLSLHLYETATNLIFVK